MIEDLIFFFFLSDLRRKAPFTEISRPLCVYILIGVSPMLAYTNADSDNPTECKKVRGYGASASQNPLSYHPESFQPCIA